MTMRLLPFSWFDGATNMAADEVMLHAAADGVASLRLYGWTSATVSLGYFQAAAVRRDHPRLTGLRWVRRPSGGATLVHHHELTYAIALPVDTRWHGEPWMSRMHRVIMRTLAELDVALDAVTSPVKQGDVLCFQQHTPGDLRCSSSKVVGSAQRKYRQALLQHGSVLLAQSEYTPELPGIKELADRDLTVAEVSERLLATFAADTGWTLRPGDWTEAERQAMAATARDKYQSASWNERR